MRMVTEVKKSTTLKQLHPSMVPDAPTGDSIPQNSSPLIRASETSSLTAGSSDGCSSNGPSSSHFTDKTHSITPDGDNSSSESGDENSKSDRLLESGDAGEKETKCESPETGGAVKASCDGASGGVKVVAPQVPKMVYFFERGDSLKEDLNSNVMKEEGGLKLNLTSETEWSLQMSRKRPLAEVFVMSGSFCT